MYTLKTLAKAAIPGALEKAERYRLLNEPLEAESICRDVLAVEPDNQQASIILLLALTGALLAVTVACVKGNQGRLATDPARHLPMVREESLEGSAGAH